MGEDTKDLLEKILASQVLLLAGRLEAKAKSTGTISSTSDYTREASRLIQRRQSEILQLLR